MTSPRKQSRFCGIDVGKNKHVACVIDHENNMVVRSQSFTNDAEGYPLILKRLQEVGGPPEVAIAMEATGHYWYSLHDFLVDHHYDVAVLNPLQTARQVTKGIRKSQTDRIDAHHIAVLLKNGEHRPAVIPGELALTCRRLTRLQHNSLFGETDPIQAFRSPAQLIAFAGLDLVVSQSGQYQAPRRHISKRGSPHLRHTLWNMAHRACYQEGDLREYWLRLKAKGLKLKYKETVIAATIKLCPVVWRIMTDCRPYLPQRPVTTKS